MFFSNALYKCSFQTLFSKKKIPPCRNLWCQGGILYSECYPAPAFPVEPETVFLLHSNSENTDFRYGCSLFRIDFGQRSEAEITSGITSCKLNQIRHRIVHDVTELTGRFAKLPVFSVVAHLKLIFINGTVQVIIRRRRVAETCHFHGFTQINRQRFQPLCTPNRLHIIVYCRTS